MPKLNKVIKEKFNAKWEQHIILNPDDDTEEKKFQFYLVYASAWSDCMLFLDQSEKTPTELVLDLLDPE